MDEHKTKKRKRQYFDYSLLAVLIFLMGFGLIMLYSSSAYVISGNSMFYFKRQLVFCAGGIVIMYVTSKISYRRYIILAKYLYIISLILMALVQTPLGKEVNGARRWIRLPLDQQIQPAEVAKVALILFIPVLIIQLGREIETLRGMGKVFLFGLVSAGCAYFLTENLSTAVILVGITCVLIFEKHPKTLPFIALGIAFVSACVAAAVLWGQRLADGGGFRGGRIVTWLNPEKYPTKEGFQTLHGLYAIGSGGLFGKGLGSGTQKRVIPEVQNDMIFSSICEELGLFGALIVLILFAVLLYRLIFIARNAPDQYGSLIVTGVFAHIMLQVVLNIAVVVNLIPNTGISLPFISYGGTSLLFLLLEIGIVLGVSRKIKFDD